MIDPVKKDSFEKYIYNMAIRYHVRNIPTCYFSGFHPLKVNTANNVTTRGDTITYMIGLTGRFYFAGDKLFVYNKANHRDYTYHSVEVSVPLFYVSYFLKREMRKRLGME